MTRCSPRGLALLRQLLDGPVDALAQRVEQARALALEDDFKPVVLGRYQLLQELGRGTYGVVFAARDEVLEREVAVKVLHAGGGFWVALQEARLLARVRHPNVVAVHDVSRIGTYDVVVMDCIDGVDLHRARRGLDWRELMDVFLQAARGLAAAHRLGVVHGDVKPSNILVDHGGRAYLADFGQARVPARDLQLAPARGTDAYLAPECRHGAAIDARADQYSLCASMGESLDERRFLAVGSDGRDRALRGVLRRGMLASPKDRFADVDALIDAIEVVLQGRGARRAS